MGQRREVPELAISPSNQPSFMCLPHLHRQTCRPTSSLNAANASGHGIKAQAVRSPALDRLTDTRGIQLSCFEKGKGNCWRPAVLPSRREREMAAEVSATDLPYDHCQEPVTSVLHLENGDNNTYPLWQNNLRSVV
ncbi:serine palmitoyltransferase 3 [Platysternon megacephalum]|uniref:Serine palmitoyltransferase 3 n=1 Tax=Platysternon megacephalum TaxID=55544 RepID=A0A4D9EF63_9SAUR|nr:serine palmitoyltransferase 3 [Platysternon megacephalum]